MKKNILILALFISFITLAQGPEFEVYTGITIPVDKNIGHIIDQMLIISHLINIIPIKKS
jgi:hypothetical protein